MSLTQADLPYNVARMIQWRPFPPIAPGVFLVEIGWASRAAEALIARSAAMLVAAAAVTVLASCWKPLTSVWSSL